MNLPSNATLEEQERFAYIGGDLERVKLLQRIQELEDDYPSCSLGGVGWEANHD